MGPDLDALELQAAESAAAAEEADEALVGIEVGIDALEALEIGAMAL